MLKIWGRRNSCNVQKVMWLVSELKISHEHIPAGGSYGGLDTPEFLAMNPHGHVPVIKDHNTSIWESHTILRYLAASYGKNIWWLDAPASRAQIEQWMDWQQTALQPDFIGGVFWNFYRMPEFKQDKNLIAAKIEASNKHFLLLNHILQGKKYVCGNNISLADIPLGTMLYRYFNLDIKRPHLPNVENWYNRLQERSAFRDHVMIPFHDLKGKETF